MITVVRMTGRLLLAHWPALVAWFLAGILVRYIVIEIAGFVGAYTAIGGQAILPLAILARLVSFVAMFLVVRDGLAYLGVLAPLPADPAQRRRAFLDAVLGGVLPFFAFYAAWGFLAEDVGAYLNRALEVQQGLRLATIFTQAEFTSEGTVDDLTFGPVTAGLIVVAFAGRWAWKRYAARMPRLLSLVAVYLEALWVFLSVSVIAAATGAVTGWAQSRQAMVWLADLRGSLVGPLAPFAFVWDGVEWVLGEAGGIILLPVAWLVIAGVVYGQAVAPQAPALAGRIARVTGDRFARVPGWARRRANDVWGEVTGRFRPIGRSFVLMWRAGPLLIGGYVFAYTCVVALQRVLDLILLRLIGPHDLEYFWLVADGVLLLIVPLVVEPLRIALIASTYDRTVAQLVRPAQPEAESAGATASSGVDGEADEPRQ